MEDDGLRRAAWLMLSESGAHEKLARRAIERFGWDCKLGTARARISQWVNPDDPHQLPLVFADDWIEITTARGAADRITPLLHRAAMRGEDQRAELAAEPEPERQRIHRVEPTRGAGRRRA